MNHSMSKFLLTFFLAVLAIFVPGCLDIEEEVFLNSDGSGTYVSRFDLNGLTDLIMMTMPDSITEQMGDNPDAFLDSILTSQEMVSSLAAMTEQFDGQEGISNSRSEVKNGILTLQMEFASIASLNEALTNSSQENQFGMMTPLFDWSKKSLSRSAASTGEDMDPELASQMDMLKMMMGDGNFVTRYHFPGKVKSASNPDSRIIDGGKTVETTYNLSELIENPALADQEIKFKKR